MAYTAVVTGASCVDDHIHSNFVRHLRTTLLYARLWVHCSECASSHSTDF